MKGTCASARGKLRHDSQAVVSQHIPEQLHSSRGGLLGGAPTAARQLLLMRPVLKRVSDSLTTVKH